MSIMSYENKMIKSTVYLKNILTNSSYSDTLKP